MYRHLRCRTVAKPQAIAIGAFDGDAGPPEVQGRPELSVEAGKVQTLYRDNGKANSGGTSQRIFLLGLGHRDKPDAAHLRAAGAALVKAAFAAKIQSIELNLAPVTSGRVDDATVGRAIGDGVAIGNFSFTDFKGTATRNKDDKPLDLTLSAPKSMRGSIDRALKLGESVNLARSLAATPPNIANPAYIANYCRRMARQTGLQCGVIDAAKARQLKMGGLLAVGAGGSTPPSLICLEHKPPGAKGKPIMLVGKAITFDTGGYSIKPTASMVSMKYDKCGGMAVIGAMHAVAKLGIKQHVVGLIPAAENMVDTKAYRPADIITFCNGVTCEITNTDAEGRLVLGDALAYGSKRYKPRAIIDLATLTGGVVVALGTSAAGCFCRDASLRQRLLDAADFTGERLWHLPLWEEHKQLLKSNHADIANSGPREAHASQGAAFLWHFVDDDMPWAHLDIAGVADAKDDNALYTKGPTGFGVRLLVETLADWR
jgi:leucyl aminopeptidase